MQARAYSICETYNVSIRDHTVYRVKFSDGKENVEIVCFGESQIWLPGHTGGTRGVARATKNTTVVMFEPSQGVLEASRRVPQRPRAYRMPPGVSQSVLEHPESLQECLPGVSWTLEGHKKTLVSSIQCLLEGSDNFVPRRPGMLWKPPEASQSVPEVSRNVSEHPPAGSWQPSKCPKASQSV